MKYIKSYKSILESSKGELEENLPEILFALIDSCNLCEMTYYNISGYECIHYSMDTDDVSELIEVEIKRVRNKIVEFDYDLIYHFDSKLYIAFVPINLLKKNLDGFNDLKKVDHCRYKFDLPNGEQMSVLDLDKFEYGNVLNRAYNLDVYNYEILEPSLDDVWRTDSPLIITLTMWNYFIK